MNEPIGWIFVKKGDRVKTGGTWSGMSSKLYQSVGRAKSALSQSSHARDPDVKIVPVYIKEEDVRVVELSGKEILDLPMQNNDANAKTIGEYLTTLLRDLFNEGEGFSSKRPFGNSGWQYELYQALANASVIEVTDDEYGDYDTAAAEDAINRAIAALYESK